MTQLILVDSNDQQIGLEEKLKTHELGLLHRAFSIFVFNQQGQLLLQRRALNKYHSGGLWTNTVCSHPQPDEDIMISCQTRLMEEMGFSTSVKEIFSFIYRSDYDNGLIEHEFDHVFVGYYNSNPLPNPDEVYEYRWQLLDELYQDVNNNSHYYTTWFTTIITNKEYFAKLLYHCTLGHL